MGLFGTASSPFDLDVEKVTNEKNTSDQWSLIMEICDRAGASAADAKDCLRSIWKRLNHQDPHVALHACTLLDACVNNSGRYFHLEVASRGFEMDFRKLIYKAHPKVREKLREILVKWAEGDFKTDPQLNIIPALLAQLKEEGMDFTPQNEPKSKQTSSKPQDPYAVSSQEEEDDLVKAITLSLKEASPKTAAQNLYPSTSTTTAHSSHYAEARKVRALYDFEAVEDNELTFKSGELIHVLDDSDPNWWKGYNKRGEGLFPANFVTADLSAEPENFKPDQPKKAVHFNETVTVKTLNQDEVEINEEKIDRLLHLLHEANPEEDHSDTAEMLNLEEQVNMMGPLIDNELERVDRKHAQLTQLSADLVEALNLYHTLMREQSSQPPQVSFQPKGPPFGYPPSPAHAFNGGPPQGMPLGPNHGPMGPQMGPQMGPPLGPPLGPQGYTGLADYGALGPNSLPPMGSHFIGQAAAGPESLQYPNSIYAGNPGTSYGVPGGGPFIPHGLPPPQHISSQPQSLQISQQPPPPGTFSPPTQPLL